MVGNMDKQEHLGNLREENEVISSITNELGQLQKDIQSQNNSKKEYDILSSPRVINFVKWVKEEDRKIVIRRIAELKWNFQNLEDEEAIYYVRKGKGAFDILSNPRVINFVKWLPEKKRKTTMREIVELKWNFQNLKDDEVIYYVREGKDESDLYFEYYDKNDARYILSRMYKLIDEWKDPIEEEIFIPEEVGFYIDEINNSLELKDDKKFLRFDALPEDIKKVLLGWIERKYKSILRKDINKILEENPEISAASLFDNDEIFQLFIKYHNVKQLWDSKTTLDWKSLSDNDKQKLLSEFKTTLHRRWFHVNDVEENDVDENILKELEEREKRIHEENNRLLEEHRRKSKEINSRLQWYSTAEDTDIKTKVVENVDIQNASWVDIARNAWIWKQLMEQYNSVEDQEEWQHDGQIFSITWPRFIESHNELKSYITEDVILNLYDQNNNTIKNLNDWARDWLKKIFQDHPDEILKIYNLLLNFPDEINNTKKELAENAESKRNIYDENKINYAIGAIIDDVRDVFSTVNNKENINDKGWNFNWFKLNKEHPVEKIWNDIIISGSFDGSDVKIRYDLETGKLFMNSFLHKLSVDKFNVWDDSLIDLQIGQIKPFNHVLNEYNTSLKSSSYDNSNNEVDKVLDSQMDLIGNAIKENSQNQAYKNSAITNFMRTFNIVSDSWRFNSFDFNNWSNLFDVIQILDNSDFSNLEYFNNVFMPTVMEYSWLKYWEKNIIQDKKNKKSETIFEYNGDNDNKKYLKDKIKNFNSEQFSWVANFNSNHQLWFADLIRLKITSWSKPNWKLDIKKMDDFIKGIKGENEPLPNNVI